MSLVRSSSTTVHQVFILRDVLLLIVLRLLLRLLNSLQHLLPMLTLHLKLFRLLRHTDGAYTQA